MNYKYSRVTHKLERKDYFDEEKYGAGKINQTHTLVFDRKAALEQIKVLNNQAKQSQLYVDKCLEIKEKFENMKDDEFLLKVKDCMEAIGWKNPNSTYNETNFDKTADNLKIINDQLEQLKKFPIK